MYERADSMAYELNKEESEKMEAKMTKKKKNGEKVHFYRHYLGVFVENADTGL